jgi:hypothetical protein
MPILPPRLARIGDLSFCDALPLPGEMRDLEVKYYFSEHEPELDDSDEAVLLALSEQPFASVRQPAQVTHLS